MSALIKVLKKLYRYFLYIVFYTAKLFPVNQKLVIFESYLGVACNDSPWEIYKNLKVNYPHLELMWSVKNTGLFSDNQDMRVVKRMSLKYVFQLATAKYIVSNSRLPFFFKKRNTQIYLQTWHGTPLKRLVLDVKPKEQHMMNNQKYEKSFLKDVANWSYLVSPNKHSTNCFRSAFAYKGEILEVGYPRNYELYQQSDLLRQQLRTELNISDEDIVVLYTPTFRDLDISKDFQYQQKMMLDLNALEEAKNIKVLLRLHYLIASQLELGNYKNIIDVSSYPNLNELFVISDLLLTDYSSTMFDYSILQKPLAFFPYDLELYADKMRGFYLSYSQLPGDQITTTADLIRILDDFENYVKKYEQPLIEFKKRFILETEPQATKLIVEAVFSCEKKNNK